jgi:hypothetical protein
MRRASVMCGLPSVIVEIACSLPRFPKGPVCASARSRLRGRFTPLQAVSIVPQGGSPPLNNPQFVSRGGSPAPRARFRPS